MAKGCIGIIGHFGGNEPFCDGQTVKTKNLYRALTDELEDGRIERLDTYYSRKNPISFLFKTLKLYFQSKDVIMLPDENGFRVFILLFSALNIFARKKIHYAVVGGWLPVTLGKKAWLRRLASRIEGVYVETASLKRDLDALGLTNVHILRNFKYIKPLEHNELIYNGGEPHKVCLFSRIMQEKGVEDAIAAVIEINAEAARTVYELDIYGPVDDGYKARFDELCENFPDFVSYKGFVDSEKSVDVLKNYFALLFPTRFYTEGIPGTLLDAICAGVPVITSLWANFADIFEEGVTGWGYDFDKPELLKVMLERAADKPREFLEMKQTALAAANKYRPEECIKILTQRMS